MTLIFVLLGVFIICFALMFTGSAWDAMIKFVNALLAAIIATNYFEPTADLLEAQIDPSYTYLVDILAIWFLFALAMGLMRLTTDFITQYRVRFRLPVEIGVKIGFSLLVGILMVGFTSFSLHTAPLAEDAFGLGEKPRDYSSLDPGLSWMAFAHGRTGPYGAFGWWNGDQGSPVDADDTTQVFDPYGRFIWTYSERRRRFEEFRSKNPEWRVNRGL